MDCVKRKFAVLDNIEQQQLHMGSKQSTQANQYNNSTTKRKRSNTHTSAAHQFDVHHKTQEPLSRNNSKALPVDNHQYQQHYNPV